MKKKIHFGLVLFSLALCAGCQISPSQEPSSDQMREAFSNMLVAATIATAKEAGVSDPKPYLDTILSFEKRSCVPIPETLAFFCSYEVSIDGAIPQEDGRVLRQVYGGAYSSRFDPAKGGLWVIQP